MSNLEVGKNILLSPVGGRAKFIINEKIFL